MGTIEPSLYIATYLLGVSYSYDALGRRVQRTSSASGATRFVYDGADVVRDLDGANSTVADYLNGPGIDNKVRQTTGAGISYFLTNHLGSTVALTDSSGSVGATLMYDSFGKVIAGAAPTRYTYTGRESDDETGLLYSRARWYDAGEARFESEDPIGLGGGPRTARQSFYESVQPLPNMWRRFYGPLLCAT